MSQKLSQETELKLIKLLSQFLSNNTTFAPNKEEFEALCKEVGGVTSFEDIQKEYQDNLAKDLAKMQEKVRKERSLELLKSAEINPNWRFENMISRSQEYTIELDRAISWINNFKRNETNHNDILPNNRVISFSAGSLCYIYGKPGVGKSMLAGSMCYELIEKQLRTVIFTQWHTISIKLNMLNNESREYFEYINQLIETDLLVIDEVGVDVKVITDSQKRNLGELLRSRKNRGKNTIIVSNIYPEDMEQYVGMFCYESIKNYEPILQIELVGENQRQELYRSRASMYQPQTQTVVVDNQRIASRNSRNGEYRDPTEPEGWSM